MLQPKENVSTTNYSSGVNASAHETSILNYHGNSIHFKKSNGEILVNLTEMAKPFGKRPNDFLSLPTTKELVKSVTRKYGITENQLITTIKGNFSDGKTQGTWAHRLIALSFAQWLSVDFHLICLEKIEELLTTGVATVNNDDATILNAMAILQRRLDASAQRLQILEGESEIQQETIKILEPKARYTDEVLQSTSTFTTTQIAKDLDMGAPTLNKKLKAAGVQYFQSGQWFLTARYQNKGYTDMRVAKFVQKDDTIGTRQSMVWTERGRLFIYYLIANNKI